jgi:hypothetical protein
MTRGGARSGAGRKSNLSKLQALMVGGYCEALWNQAAEDQAHARHEQEPTTKMIRQEQDRAELIPKSPRGRRMNPEITESIDDIVRAAGRQRAVSIPLKRPYGAKVKVIAVAIAWCQEKYGQTITESKALECWKEWKRFQNTPEYKASLNST